MFSSVALALPKQDHVRESNPNEWEIPGNQSQVQPTLVGEILRGRPTPRSRMWRSAYMLYIHKLTCLHSLAVQFCKAYLLVHRLLWKTATITQASALRLPMLGYTAESYLEVWGTLRSQILTGGPRAPGSHISTSGPHQGIIFWGVGHTAHFPINGRHHVVIFQGLDDMVSYSEMWANCTRESSPKWCATPWRTNIPTTGPHQGVVSRGVGPVRQGVISHGFGQMRQGITSLGLGHTRCHIPRAGPHQQPYPQIWTTPAAISLGPCNTIEWNSEGRATPQSHIPRSGPRAPGSHLERWDHTIGSSPRRWTILGAGHTRESPPKGGEHQGVCSTGEGHTGELNSKVGHTVASVPMWIIVKFQDRKAGWGPCSCSFYEM
jgi:hypothetical protein